MEATEIRRSVFALIQEIAHYHMINSGDSTIGDIADRLEHYHPIKNELNLTYATIHATDFIGFMAGNYDPTTISVASISIKGHITIMAMKGSIEINNTIYDGDSVKIYDYVKLINDVHKALGTGREIDIASYDLASIIKDTDREV